MGLNHFVHVPFGRPQSGTIIIQLMTEPQYQKPVESRTMRLIFRIKTARHNAHISKIYNWQLFKNAVSWYFRQAHFMFFVSKPNMLH